MSKIAPYYKAVTAAVVAALSALGAVLVDDKSLADVTTGQWVAVALAFFAGLGFVARVPNSPSS